MLKNATQKRGGSKKGKAPVKRQVVPQVSPPQSSSDEESWDMLKDLQAKVANLEAKKLDSRPLWTARLPLVALPETPRDNVRLK